MPLVDSSGHAAGFTGTAEGMTEPQHMNAIWLTRQLGHGGVIERFHHGDCVGADYQMAKIISLLHLVMPGLAKVQIICHPPIKPDKRAWFPSNDIILPEKDYLVRNKDIVNATDYLIATPKEKEEQLRSGTWSTVRYARKMKRLIYMVWPDGSITYEDYAHAKVNIINLKA